jgi:hypothetical protein
MQAPLSTDKKVENFINICKVILERKQTSPPYWAIQSKNIQKPIKIISNSSSEKF